VTHVQTPDYVNAMHVTMSAFEIWSCLMSKITLRINNKQFPGFLAHPAISNKGAKLLPDGREAEAHPCPHSAALACDEWCVIWQKTHNLSLPSWVNKVWDGQTTYDKLRTLADIAASLSHSQTALQRLTGGLCCHQLILLLYICALNSGNIWKLCKIMA